MDKLYNRFKNLNSEPNPSSMSPSQISVTKNKSALEQQKDTHNYLDDPFSLHEIETTIKLLKSGKAPGPDKIRNEMLKTGAPHLTTAICKLLTSSSPVVFSPVAGARVLSLPYSNQETNKTHQIIGGFA